MESAGLKAKASEHRTSSNVPGRMRKRYELLDECRELVSAKLSAALTDAVKSIGENLAAAATKSTEPKEQELLMEAVAVVRAQQIEIEKRFRKSFNAMFEKRLFAGRDGTAGKPDPVEIDMSQLSLVSEDDVNSRLVVDKIVHRSKSRLNPDEVLGMRARLGALLDRDWFDEDQQPASAQDVLETLKTTLAELSPSPAVATALLEAFEPYMTSNLNDAYNTVNQRLLAHHILPKIRQQVQRSHSKVTRPDGTVVDAQNDAPNNAPSGNGANYADTLGSMFMTPQAFEGLMDGLSRGMPMARQQATRMLTDESTFGVLDLPLPAVGEPLLDAIRHIQQLSMGAPAAGRAQLGDLKEQVQDKGTALDKLTVDIVELVFDYVYSDHRLADPIKQQLLRLQVVAIKAALLDRSFFAKRQHPLRQILDQITELGCDPDVDPSADSELAKNVTTIVSKVVTDFDSDLVVFENALSELDSVVDKEEVRRAEWLTVKTAESEREEQRVVALDDYRRELAQRVDNTVPEFLREFLFRWWGPVLAQIRTQETPVFDEAKGLNLAEMLLWSVSQKTAEEVPKLASLLPQLITGIIKGLGTVDCPAAEREAFFNDLLKIHTKAIDSAKQVALAPRPIGVVIDPTAAVTKRTITMSQTGQVTFTPAPQTTENNAHNAPTLSLKDAGIEIMFRGARLDIIEDSGDVQRYKLAWISPSKKLYLLSRYPHEPLSLSRNDFASWIESGKARLASDDSIVGKAIDSAANGSSLRPAIAA